VLNGGEKMNIKRLGIWICILGSIVAIMFPPCKILGMSAGWHFIFECEKFFGTMLCTYHFIDISALLLELILINGIGLALYFYGMKQEEVSSVSVKRKVITKRGAKTVSYPICGCALDIQQRTKGVCPECKSSIEIAYEG